MTSILYIAQVVTSEADPVGQGHVYHVQTLVRATHRMLATTSHDTNKGKPKKSVATPWKKSGTKTREKIENAVKALRVVKTLRKVSPPNARSV